MKKFPKIAMVLGLTTLVALSGCDASMGEGGDGESTDAGEDASGGGTDTSGGGGTGGDTSGGGGTGGDTSGGGGGGGGAGGYLYVTIDGAPDTNSDCKTNSVGADIDVIAVYRGGQLIGVGKPGTVKFLPGAKPLCATWGVSGQCSYGTIAAICHNDPQDVAGGLNTKMYADATPDTGYFGLGSGTVEVQIGGCTVSTDKVSQCDGNGPVVTLQSGDEVDVYEVDATYQKGGGGEAAGIAPDKCPNVCKPEAYEVWVSKQTDKVDVSLGVFSGSKSYIKVP